MNNSVGDILENASHDGTRRRNGLSGLVAVYTNFCVKLSAANFVPRRVLLRFTPISVSNFLLPIREASRSCVRQIQRRGLLLLKSWK